MDSVNFEQAHRESRLRMIPGSTLCAGCAVSTSISIIKFLLSHAKSFEVDNELFHTMIGILKVFHENTQFLDWFWRNSPTPNPLDSAGLVNITFIAVYIGFFFTLALYFSGYKLSKRLNEINRLMEDQIIQHSILQDQIKLRNEKENMTNIARISVFSQTFPLFVMPTISTLLCVMLLIKLGYY